MAAKRNQFTGKRPPQQSQSSQPPQENDDNLPAPSGDNEHDQLSASDLARAAGFEGTELATVTAVTNSVREEAEVKAALVLARQFPRDEQRAAVRIYKACDRPDFAEDATYRFERGGSPIVGPSVYFAREAAKMWGNIQFGLKIHELDTQANQAHIEGWAYDVETNVRVRMEARFNLLIQRKVKGTNRTEWKQPDERDLRELVNRHGAIALRNAILQLLPTDLVETAIQRSHTTRKKTASGQLNKDHAAAVRQVAMAFDSISVTTEMLAKRLGHKLDTINAEELVALREIFNAIKAGESKREEFFDIGEATLKRPEERGQPAAGAAGAKPAKDPTAAPPPSSETKRGEPAEWEKLVVFFAEKHGVEQSAAADRLEGHAKKMYRGVSLDKLNPRQLADIRARIEAGDVVP